MRNELDVFVAHIAFHHDKYNVVVPAEKLLHLLELTAAVENARRILALLLKQVQIDIEVREGLRQ